MVGERLRTARRIRGFTQEQLGQAVGGLTKAAISAYERDERTPGAATIRRLAHALGLPGPSALFATPRHAVTWSGYRRTSRLGAAERLRIEASAAEKANLFLELRGMVDPDRALNLPTPRQVDSLAAVEEAAAYVREGWDCGTDPIAGLTALVEQQGAIVLGCSEGADFDGLAGEVADKGGAVPVLVVSEDVPSDRLRLSTAHELGHWSVRVAPRAPAELTDDTAAFRFGAALLVPQEAARAELGTHRARLSLPELVELKQRYGLSIAAWIRRARDLAIIDENEYVRWNKHLRVSGLYRDESVRYPHAGDERPSRLTQMLAHALAEGYVTERWAQQRLPYEWAKLVQTGDVTRGSAARELRRLPKEEREAALRHAATQAATEDAADPESHVFAGLEGEPFDES